MCKDRKLLLLSLQQEKAKRGENGFCWARQRIEISGQTAAPKSGERRESRVKLEICPSGAEATDW